MRIRAAGGRELVRRIWRARTKCRLNTSFIRERET